MVQESLTYKLLYTVCSYFGRIWRDSLIARGLKKCGNFFRAIFSNSAVVKFIAGAGMIERSYESSVLFKAVDGLLNLPQRIVHPLYKKAEPVLYASLFFRVLVFMLRKLHLIAAGFLFIAMIIRHDFWNNLYSAIAMAVLLLLFFMRTIVEGRTGFKTGAFNVFLALFLICVVFGEIFSIMPSNSLRFLAFYLTCFMLVLIMIASIRSQKDLSDVLAILLAGMTIAGLYGIYQYIVGVPVNASWIDTSLNQGNMKRVYSFFYNPNNFAEIILLFTPFYFAAFFNTKKRWKKMIYLAMAVPPVLALLMTLSRGAWVAFVLAAIVFVFFKEKRLIPVVIVAGFLAAPFLPQSIIFRIKTILNPEDSSTQTRVQIFQTVIPILKDYWFTGLGLGNETLLRVSKNYYSFIEKGSIPSHSHNLYLQVWLETGFPGIVTFLAFILATVKKSIKFVLHSEDTYMKNILIAGLASLIGTLAIGMIEYVWFYQRVMLFFWAVIGIILAALTIREKEEKGNYGEMAKSLSKPAEGEMA